MLAALHKLHLTKQRISILGVFGVLVGAIFHRDGVLGVLVGVLGVFAWREVEH